MGEEGMEVGGVGGVYDLNVVVVFMIKKLWWCL